VQYRSFLSSVIIASVALVACGGNEANQDASTRDDSGEVVEGGDVGVLKLEVGDCLAAEAVGEVGSAPVVPCSELHDSELFDSFELAGDEFPGVQSVVEQAQAGCIERFDAFIGLAYEESIWEVSLIYPTEMSWNTITDREVLCGVYPVSDEDTTGSAEGIAE